MTEDILETGLQKIASCNDLQELQNIRHEILGKTSPVNSAMKNLASIQGDERKEFGSRINQIKQALQKAFDEKLARFEEEKIEKELLEGTIDMTLPSRPKNRGSIHPITQVMEELVQIFAKYGFTVETGPDIESDWYNFSALNIADDHPARQMHDSFYLAKEGRMLRTHTSPIQIRTCIRDSNKLPLRFIAPGRTYRADSDATHTPMFHQIEGMCVDKNVNMGNLKYILIDFIHNFFQDSTIQIRFRPELFPFTEPSAEVDIKIKETDDWLEVLGCGMVHPNVLANVGIDSSIYQGLAFGLGVERFAMLKYGMKDLRQFFDGDKRWLSHYNFSSFNIPNIFAGGSK